MEETKKKDTRLINPSVKVIPRKGIKAEEEKRDSVQLLIDTLEKEVVKLRTNLWDQKCHLEREYKKIILFFFIFGICLGAFACWLLIL